MFYQAVVAAVLSYDSETWCLSGTVRHSLEGFHVKATRRLMGMQTLEHYIDKRRHTIANTIRGRLMLEECMGEERATGTPIPP